MLRQLENNGSRKVSKGLSEIAPVFIVGLPRSGTTLLYQLLLNYFDWSYFTGWSEYFYLAPVTAYRIQRVMFPEPKHFEYVSDYGRFKGVNWASKAWSPVEGRAIWNRWFTQVPDDVPRHLNVPDIEQIRSIIGAFVELSGRPFLNKNGVHCLRILALSQIFPKAVFIVLRRQSVYVAQSLYIARTRSGRKHSQNWWGTKPKEYTHLKQLDPLRQAVGQTKALEMAIETQCSSDSRYIEIKYHDLCEQPGKLLQQINETCLRYGVDLRKSNDVEPKPFPLRDERKVSEEQFNEIKRLLNSF